MGGREPSTGTYMKRRLLELEGVKFQNKKVSDEVNVGATKMKDP